MVRPFAVLFLPGNPSILQGTGTLWMVIYIIVMLSPLLLVLKMQHRLAAFCVLAIVLNMIPSGHLGITVGGVQNARFVYTSSVFFAIAIASLFARGLTSRLKQVTTVLLVVYLATMALVLHQNSLAWLDAGTLVRKAIVSTRSLVRLRQDERGVEKTGLLAFNVPTDYIGAWTFKTGFPEMMHLEYPNEMQGVAINVLHGGIQVAANIQRMEEALREGTVVWFFDDTTWTFAEYELLHDLSTQ